MRSSHWRMFLAVWCVLLFQSAAFGETPMESPKFCSKTSDSGPCSKPGCEGSTAEPCYHGDCSDSGKCICLPCWRGSSCSEPGNDHVPAFVQAFYEVYISPDESTEYPFLYVRATDKDQETCGVHCPCAQVSYSLDDGDQSAKTSAFTIDPITGGISVTRGAKLVPNTAHDLKVYAINGADFQHQGTVPVTVRVSDAFLGDSGQSVKLRRLLTTATPEIQTLQNNGNLDITFLPAASNISVGILGVGTRVYCELTIKIPKATLVPVVNIEVFTADNSTKLSVLCPPTVTKGSEIDVTGSTAATLSYENQDGNPFLHDTATLNFGNVTNQQNTDSDIVIMLSITLKDYVALDPGTRYWVSAGVEYNDESKLWIGQIGFLINNDPQSPPDTTIAIREPPDVYKDEVQVFELDIHVYRSVANLTVMAAVGSLVKPYLMICELTLCNTGTGFCLDASKDLATYSLDEVTKVAHQSAFSFGTIVNGGANKNSNDSYINMDVVTYLATEATDMASYDLSASAHDGVKESQNTATFTAKASRTYITPGRQITMNASLYNSDGNLAPMHTAKLRVAFEVPASTSVRPVKIRVEISPATKEVAICSVRINHIHRDFSCLEQRREDIEKSVIYGNGMDVTIELGGVANTGGDNNATVGVDFAIYATDMAINNAPYTATVTLTYASLTLTDSVTLTTYTDLSSITYPAVPENAPYPAISSFDILSPSRTTEVAPGEYILLVIRHIIQPDTHYRYTANALVNTTDATIVVMKMTKVGSNLVCGMWSDPKATYTNFFGGFSKDMAEIDMPSVYNLGRSTPPTQEQDGLEIVLAVQVTPGTSDDSVIPVAVSLLVGATRLWVAEANITVKASLAASPLLPTNNTLAPAPGHSTEVTVGARTQVIHYLVIPADTSFKYTVNYTTTEPWLQITNVNVTTVGERLLCTQGREFSPIYSLSSLGSIAFLDLDYVCSIALANDTDENNQLVIELTVETINSSDTQVGASAVLSAQLEGSNILEASVEEIRTVFFSLELPKSTFKLCCPESAHYMRPGETERCNVTMTILDDSLTFKLELETPFNETAAMTLSNVEVGSGGFNLQFVQPKMVLRSAGSTTQNNLAVIDFGKIVNTRAHTVADGNLQDGDEDMVVYIDIQMSDGSLNTNGSYHALEAGVGVSSGLVIWVAYYKLGVLRDGTERPNLNVSYSQNGSSTYSLGDKVWYSVDMTHTMESHAEALNVKGHIFLPPYIKFESMVPNYELSSIQPEIGQSNDNTGFYFTIPRMVFTDRVAFSIETTIKTDYRYKLTKNWKGTTPIEVIYYMQYYDTNHYNDGQYFSEPMDYLTYDFTVQYPDIPGPNPRPSCPLPQALGMESGTIQDCQITASFAPDTTADAHHARLNGASGWKTLARAGPFLYDRWIKVDLGKKSAVTGVKTQGWSAAAGGDLGQFDVLYSLDDTLYMTATPSNNQAFDHQKGSPADHNAIVDHTFITPVEARYVIVNLTAYDYNRVSKWYNALRMEIMGCLIDLTPASDVCPTPSPSLVGDSYERGFIVDQDSDTLFVCDTITHGLSGMRKELQASVYAFLWKKPDMQCFKMIYAEKQWTGLDPRLRNIIGYLPSTGRLYGTMSNAPDTYAASDAPYSNWVLITTDDYNTAAASPGFVQKVPVPFESSAAFSYTSPDNYIGSAFKSGDWKATMSGIYKGTEKLLDWNECCQPSCAANGGLDGCT